jgi:hypothetical protein
LEEVAVAAAGAVIVSVVCCGMIAGRRRSARHFFPATVISLFHSLFLFVPQKSSKYEIVGFGRSIY